MVNALDWWALYVMVYSLEKNMAFDVGFMRHVEVNSLYRDVIFDDCNYALCSILKFNNNGWLLMW